MNATRSLVVWTLLASASVPSLGDGGAPRITHGVAVGDVTATSAVIWARSDGEATLRVAVGAGADLAAARRFQGLATGAADFTAQVVADGLEPATGYSFRVVFENAAGVSEARSGRFSTAPPAGIPAAVRFVVGGDVGGQGVCRHAEKGYEIFRAMAGLEPDFFIANGDMIYADDTCPEAGPGGWPNVPGDFPRIDDPAVDWNDSDRVREVFLAHWRYNRADPHHQAFLRRVPIYAQWDDHEVLNDFGASWESWSKEASRAGFPKVVEAGRRALFAWNPMTRDPGDPSRIYRSFRWGREVELFLLDARSYRSLNDLVERPGQGKELLGRAQLEWLIDGLRTSDATWKIVSSDVPLSVPTGSEADLYGRDAFADGDHPWEATGFAARTGFEGELRELLEALDAGDVRNLVFVATDVHFAANLRYRIDLDGDGAPLLFHELLSGPLNAGCAPSAARLDPTFRPVILYAEAGLFNFSYVRVERRGERSVLTAEVRDVRGEVRFGSRLELIAEKP